MRVVHGLACPLEQPQIPRMPSSTCRLGRPEKAAGRRRRSTTLDRRWPLRPTADHPSAAWTPSYREPPGRLDARRASGYERRGRAVGGVPRASLRRRRYAGVLGALPPLLLGFGCCAPTFVLLLGSSFAARRWRKVARCSPRALSRISSSARGWSSRIAASTSSGASPVAGACIGFAALEVSTIYEHM